MNRKSTFLSKNFLLGASLLMAHQLQAQNMALDWVKGLPTRAEISGMDKDPNDNTYVVGTFNGTVDFDPGLGVFNLTASGSLSDVFILKLDPIGDFVWAKQIEDEDFSAFQSSTMGFSLEVDEQSNVLIAGHFQDDTTDMDPGSGVSNLVSNGGYDAFILKLDSAGDYAWAKGIGGIYNDIIQAVISDPDGNVYATGQFRQTVDFDPGSGTSTMTSPGSNDIFVLKLNSNGDFEWASQYSAPGGLLNVGKALTRDIWGNIYVCGQQRISGSYAGYVWKLDSTGNNQWSTIISGPGDDDASSITCDSFGHIYLTGTFEEIVSFGQGSSQNLTASSASAADVYILKMDSAGSVVWAKGIGTQGYYLGSFTKPYITLDATNKLFVTSNFTGTTDFDPGPGTANLTSNSTNTNTFILKMDSTGNYLWAKAFGNDRRHLPSTEIVSDNHGNLWCAGQFYDTVDFEPGAGMYNLASPVNTQSNFVLKLICNDTSMATLNEIVCESNYSLNGETYTASGTYTQIQPNVDGCDSIITLNLTFVDVNPIIAVEGFVLRTTVPYASYQWFVNGSPINEADQSTYTVTQNGDYKVAVTNENGCTDTSDSYTVNNVSIEDINTLAGKVRIYPNPTQDLIHIQSPIPIDIALLSIEGKLIQQLRNAATISLNNLSPGVYLLRISNEDGELLKVEKLVKQLK